MTDSHLWATIALAAMLGCGVILYFFARSVLPIANAFKVQAQINKDFDDRIRRILETAREARNAKAPPAIPGAPLQATVSPLAEIFGGNPLEAIGEQPDSEGIEVREA